MTGWASLLAIRLYNLKSEQAVFFKYAGNIGAARSFPSKSFEHADWAEVLRACI